MVAEKCHAFGEYGMHGVEVEASFVRGGVGPVLAAADHGEVGTTGDVDALASGVDDFLLLVREFGRGGGVVVGEGFFSDQRVGLSGGHAVSHGSPWMEGAVSTQIIFFLLGEGISLPMGSSE